MRNSSSRWRKWETTDLSDAVPLCEHQLGDGVQGNDSQDEGRECEAQQVGPWREDVGLVVGQRRTHAHRKDKHTHTRARVRARTHTKARTQPGGVTRSIPKTAFLLPRWQCVKVGSDDKYFNVSFIVTGKVTRQCPETTTFEEKTEPRRRIEPITHPLTTLTP